MGLLSDRLAHGRPLLLDGAMGTELDRRGVRTFLPLWSAWGLVERPEIVKAIHCDYATAGADILITNTFRTTRRMLERAGRDPDEAEALDALAVRMAREAASESRSNSLIAGSIAPLEDCYSPWLSPGYEVSLAEHRIQAFQLADAGADLLMVETMPLIEEAEAAVTAALETGLDVTVGFVIDIDGRLPSGESIVSAIERLASYPITAFFMNCSPTTAISTAISELIGVTTLPLGAYANLGTIEETVGWTADDTVSAEAYASAALGWIREGAQMVGGCCGTRPEHIAAIRGALDELPVQPPLVLT